MMTCFRWRRGVAAFALALPVLAVAGCDQRASIAAETTDGSASGADPSGQQACADFEAGWEGATDTPERLQLADRVERSARRSDNAAIAESATAMGRSADAGDQAWRAASADLLRACRQAGVVQREGGQQRDRPAEESTAPAVLPVTG